MVRCKKIKIGNFATSPEYFGRWQLLQQISIQMLAASQETKDGHSSFQGTSGGSFIDCQNEDTNRT